MKTNKQNAKDAAVGSSDVLGRRGFALIPRGSLEEKRIRDEMRRLRVVRDSSQLGFSESESDFLYGCSRIGRTYRAKARLTPDGGIQLIGLFQWATIIQHKDILLTRLYRTLCIQYIRCLRPLRRLKLFLLGISYKRDSRPNLLFW